MTLKELQKMIKEEFNQYVNEQVPGMPPAPGAPGMPTPPAAGGPGVARAIEIIQTDVLRTMKLLGCPSVKDLNGSYVTIPDSWK